MKKVFVLLVFCMVGMVCSIIGLYKSNNNEQLMLSTYLFISFQFVGLMLSLQLNRMKKNNSF
jgi:hypothetical protein